MKTRVNGVKRPELLPCANCEARGKYETSIDGRSVWVICTWQFCLMQTPACNDGLYSSASEMAAKRWNRREKKEQKGA